MVFGDVAFHICENGVFKEKNVRLNSAGCEPHSRSDECFLFENPIFTLLKRHVRKRHVYRLPRKGKLGDLPLPWEPLPSSPVSVHQLPEVPGPRNAFDSKLPSSAPLPPNQIGVVTSVTDEVSNV